MSAAVCGKRPFFEDHYGTSPNVKKTRRGSSSVCLAGEPFLASRSADMSHDQEQLLVQLHGLFPNMNGQQPAFTRPVSLLAGIDYTSLVASQLLKEVLASCGYNLQSAIQRFQTLYANIDIRESIREGGADVWVDDSSTSRAAPLDGSRIDTSVGSATPDGRQWVELVVREMLSASDVADARARATRALEAFEKAMKLQSGSAIEILQKENAVMKEQLQGFLRDNHVLKRAVAIQHERRQGEHENWSREVEQLKQLLSRQQEHMKTLELNNYALNVHLRRFQAGNASTMMERFHPDVF